MEQGLLLIAGRLKPSQWPEPIVVIIEVRV